MHSRAKKSQTQNKRAQQADHSTAQDVLPAKSAQKPSALGSFYSAAPVMALGPVQTKVAVGPAHDAFEVQADAVADSVVAGRSPPPVTPLPVSHSQAQRQPEEEEEEEELLQTKPIQRQSEEEEKEEEEEAVQTKGAPGEAGASGMSAAAQHAIDTRGGGKALHPGVRNRLETSMGADFGGVRVHDDSSAHQSNVALKSRAFTHGQDIWLGQGESQTDLHLMAHETTHVIQQTGVVRRSPLDDVESGAGETIEEEVSTAGALPEDTPSPAPPAPAIAEGGLAPTPEAVTPPSEQVTPVIEEAMRAQESEVEEAPAGEQAPAEELPPAAAGAEEGRTDVELVMPEPATELNEDEQQRLRSAQGGAGRAATAEETLPSAESNVSEARGAVDEPQEETSARAQAELVAALDERPAPSPEIDELCERIREVIRSKRPPDEDSLVEADPEAMAQEAGGQLNDSVESDTDRVGGSYDEMQEPPAGEAQQQGEEMDVPSEDVETPAINAEQAAPDELDPEQVSLDEDVEANRERIAEAGMDSEAAQEIRDPSNPVVAAREAQGELEETAETNPAEVLAQAQEARAGAQADMAALQAQALQALNNSRRNTIQNTSSQQTGMVGSEEQMRREASRQAQAIYNDAQTQVNNLLQPLTRTAMTRWETGVAVLSTRFESRLQRVADWIEERHSGVGGLFVGAVDYFAGLPDWVTEEYDDAEQQFGDGVCALIREISTEVNSVVAAAEAIIADADTQIANLFSSLPESLREWANGEQARFGQQLNALHNRVTETRDNFNRDLANRAGQAVDEVRQRVHELRQAARGLIGRIADAIDAFLEDPVKFIIEGLLSLLGIPPAAFWAVVNRIQQVISDIADDPLGFASNLLDAIGQGFQQFFDNIVDHLLNGFLQWLFSGLGAVGVTIPSDFSLKSIITFFLQLMGITWARIRRLLARHLGEENVALIERAYELIATLIEMGPEGIFEMIKEQLNPQNIIDMVIEAAVDFLIEALIRQVTMRIIAMFNPVGAIVQALEAIYRVLKWIFENAARIFRLVETVVNGIADILAGNIGGMANAVEQALAGLIPPVIDFLAGFLGLGNLPDRIADTIRGFQERIESILDRVIEWLASRARALLRTLGIGGEEEEAEGGAYDGQIGKVATWSAAGESHRMWIAQEGGNAVVMMSSQQKPVSEQLDEYQQMANNADNETKQAVNNKIGSARAILSELDAKADDLAEDIRNPEADQSEIQSEDDAVESTEDRLVRLLREIREALGLTEDDNFGTQQNPIPMQWPKRASAAYPLLFVGPRSSSRIPQSTLAQHAGEEYMGTHVETYHPHERKALPGGGPTIGITPEWQISAGKMIKLIPRSTMGGGLINRTLSPYGYRARSEGRDGDHVTEMQVGGENVLENLWPLRAGENRSSGSRLSSMRFPVPGSEREETMPDLKDKARGGQEIWFTITSTL